MKDFILGLVLGILLATTGTYAIIKEKAKQVITNGKTEKVAKDITETVKDVFE